MNLKQSIGTDEAGYGPNLGPLVIACSCWEFLTDSNDDLYQRLAPLVTNASNAPVDQLQITDSKQLYRTGNLERLERNVLAIIGTLYGRLPGDGFELLRWLLPEQDWMAISDTFWLAPFLPTTKDFAGGEDSMGRFETEVKIRIPVPFPLESDRKSIQDLSARFHRQCQSAGVKLSKIQCRMILPTAFNQQLSQGCNKAELLSDFTLGLIQKALESNPDCEIDIHCDKHGGRSHYASLIQHFLSDSLVTVETETLAISRYQFQYRRHPAAITFSAKGEAFLPIALSSMVAKYLREYLMLLWNRFWQIRLPNIKPTQGYPVDAQRFLAEIDELLKTLDIPRDCVWRRK